VWFGGIVAVALALRIALVLATPHFVPTGDPADYNRNAISIATGHGMAVTQIASPGGPSAYRAPAYPYLLGILYWAVGIHASAGRLLSALLGTLTVALLVAVVSLLWDRRWALAVGGVAAVYPPLIALNASLLSESLFIPLALATALSIDRIARARGYLRWCAAAGALCGVAALTRSVGLLWLLPTMVVAARAGEHRRRSAAGVLLTAVATVLVLAPWSIRNAEAFHAFVPLSTEDGFTLAGAYNREAGMAGPFHAVWLDPLSVPSLRPVFARLAVRNHGHYNEAQLDSALRDAGLGYLRRHPSQLPVSVWLHSLRMLNLGSNHRFTTAVAYREMNLPHGLWTITSVSAQLVALIALLGIALGAVGVIRLQAGPWWLWAMALLTLAATVITAGTPRYRTPADPFLIVLDVLAVKALATRLRRPAVAT
jgi:4-amino-4-deoxy-L-arabinose transferase-like glycosyltransferase